MGRLRLADIFISYRRGDSEYIAGRIREHLVREFGGDSVFFDVDNIPLGIDFRQVVRGALSSCKVCLVIIGPRWIGSRDESSGRRIDSESDLVRIEVEAALEMGIPVVPLLVGHASIPRPNELPEALRPLAFRNGMQVRPDPDFDGDIR